MINEPGPIGADSSRRQGIKEGCFRVFFTLHLGAILYASTIPGESSAAAAVPVIDISGFSSASQPGAIPDHWVLQSFRSIESATQYSVVEDELYGPVIRAEAAGSAAMLVRQIRADPREYPILAWSWKISKTLEGSSLTKKSGDDFPVRVLVSFGSDVFNTTGGRTLCYVWASHEPVETMAPNPSRDTVVTIAVSSGADKTGRWQKIRRNILEDYFQAYGETPGTLKGIALLSDTDNTTDHVIGWYGPISLGAAGFLEN